jgi:hypothetical protein
MHSVSIRLEFFTTEARRHREEKDPLVLSLISDNPIPDEVGCSGFILAP